MPTGLSLIGLSYTYHLDGAVSWVECYAVVSEDVRLGVIELGLEDVAFLSDDHCW